MCPHFMVRVLVYSYLMRRYGVFFHVCKQVSSVSSRVGPKVNVAAWMRGQSSSGSVAPAAAHVSVSPASSEHPSDFDEDLCMGGLVFVKMEGKTTPLPHRGCSDPVYECFRPLLLDDSRASHLPVPCQVNGVSLCRIHYDVYMALRGSTICSIDNCYDHGSLAPGGSVYCSSHIVGAMKPPPPLPPRCRSDRLIPSPPNEPKGLETLPTGALSALYRRLSEEGLCEPEIVDRLATEYVVSFLENARAAHSLVGDMEDVEFERLKRRLCNIVVVYPAQAPRVSPVPNPASPPPRL